MINLKDNLENIISRGTIEKISQWLLMLIIITIPFSIRHVFNSPVNFQTGAYSDFTSLSIYLSDLLIITLIVCLWINNIYSGQPVPKLWKYSGILLTFWLILPLFVSSHLLLQFYFSTRLLLLIVFCISVSKILVSREKIAWLFTILGLLQSLIAIIQFYSQHSIGLYRLGESHLGPDQFMVAKIVSQGITLIRGYGTFPHSNLLSAFIFTAIFFNLYLLLKNYNNLTKFHVVGLYTTLYLNILGLFITFSRGGILAFGVALMGLSGVLLINKQYFRFWRTVVSCGTAILLSILILGPYLSTRTTVSDTATKERIFYNQIGIQMIKSKAVFGQGAGMSVLHMKQYTQTLTNIELQPREIQPIHNYWLISVAELGLGAIFLLFLLLFPIFLLARDLYFKIKQKEQDYWNLTLLLISGGFLILFCLDHYFYTIWPTQLLLWLITGLTIGAIPRETIKNSLI